MSELKENAIEFYSNTNDPATVSFTQGRYVSKIKKLAEKYPDQVQILSENDDGSIYAHVPVKWIRIQPNISKELTEEEIEERVKNLQKTKK